MSNEEFSAHSSAMDNITEPHFDDMEGSKLHQDIASLYLNQKFADVSFILHGQKLPAHKVILAVRSKYFETLLSESLMEPSSSEIVINDVSINVFKKLLKFIYTDRITVVAANLELILNVLDLANKYCITELEKMIAKKLTDLVDTNNVCQIIQKAEMYNLTELLNTCLTFIDEDPVEFLKSEGFKNQPEEVLRRVLERNNFAAPEIDIFTAVAQWCQTNKPNQDRLLKCVRLSLLTLDEIYFVVKPSKLIDSDVLMEAFAEVNGMKPKTCAERYLPLLNVNVASFQMKAQVITNQKTDLRFVLNANKDDTKFASFPLNDTQSFEVKFKATTYVNNINILFNIGSGECYYCYYVECSIDGTTWKTIVDYTKYKCRAFQELYFKKEMVKYLRVVGTQSSNGKLNIVSFEAVFKETIPKLMSGIICPPTNVALLKKGAFIAEGTAVYGGSILDGDVDSDSYHYHLIGTGSILIQLAQPYMIDTIRLRLFTDHNGIHYNYKYYIEISINKIDWTIIADKRNEFCSHWQDLNFLARPVVFIKIIGTADAQSITWFNCHHLECFASEELLGSDN